jgi:hypothetical protein
MYDSSSAGILGIILGIIIIITFFVIAARLGSILSILQFFKRTELKNPDHYYIMPCGSCQKEVKVSKSMRGTMICPHCKTKIKIDDV